MQQQLLPALDKDLGTQRCRLGLQLFTQLSGDIGDGVLIKRNNEKDYLLCKVWPSLFDNSIIEASDLVSCSQNTVQQKFGEYLHIFGDHRITLLDKVQPVTNVSVTIVLEEFASVHKYKCHKDNELNSVLHCILQSLIVCEGCIIDLSLTKNEKLLGLSYLLIKKIHVGGNPSCCYGIVKRSTAFSVVEIISKEKYEQTKKLEHVQAGQLYGGLDHHVCKLGEYVKFSCMFKRQSKKNVHFPKGFLLIGPSGCGKTGIINRVASECSAYLHIINGSELHGSRPGETEQNLLDAFKKAASMTVEGPSMLVLDELDSLCPVMGSDKVAADNRIHASLMSLLDEYNCVKGLTVIGVTSNPAQVDPAIRRSGRLEKEISVGFSSKKIRKLILQVLCDAITLAEDVDLDEIAQSTPGFVGAELSSLVQHAQYHAAQRSTAPGLEEVEPNQGQMLNREDFHRARHLITASGTKSSSIRVDCKQVKWQDIGGLENVKSKLRQAVEMPLKNPHCFRRLGIPSPKGVLLCGPPGCAKSTLVKALASSTNINFFAVSGAELFSPYVGDSEQKLMQIFHEARTNVPSILFIDEIDAVIGSRSNHECSPGVQERVLSTLLNEMDGIGVKLHDVIQPDTIFMEDEMTAEVSPGVLVISATNRPDVIDDALLRPGRFDKIIHVPPPDKQARQHILQIYTKKVPLDGVSIEQLAAATKGFTGADLENLCREAVLCTMSEDGFQDIKVSSKHFTQVLKVLKPSLVPH